MNLRSIVIAIMMLLLGGEVMAAWEVSRFEAYEGPPIDAPDRDETSLLDDVLSSVSPGWRELEEGQQTPKFNSVELGRMEHFLELVAAEYSSIGFADPVATGWLDSIVKDRNGDDVIRFYIYDHPDPKAPWAFYLSGKPCENTSRKVFVVNTKKFAPTGVLRGTDYATLAHELFHSIHYASAYMKNRCSVSLWLSEGTSDAIGHDMARRLWGVNFSQDMKPTTTTNNILKIFGIRKYGHPLEDHAMRESASEGERKDIGYLSSSFWRYLAEAKYVKSRDPNYPYPDSRVTGGVDYSYLVELFSTPYKYTANPNKRNPPGDIRWVNEFLKSERHIKSSVARMYARFISSFADYNVTRIGPERSIFGGTTPSTEKWLEQIFGACEQAGAIGGYASGEAEIRLIANGSGCIQAYPDGPHPANATVIIQTLSNDLGLLRQLRIGLPDGTMVNSPSIHSFIEEQPPYIARWEFPLFANDEGTYIVSNMSLQPHRTKRFVGVFHFSMGEWDTDLTTVPVPPPPAPIRKGKDHPTKKERHKKITKNAIAEPVKNLIRVGKVERKRYDKPVTCNTARLTLNLCGPQLHISLDVTPFGIGTALGGTASLTNLADISVFDPDDPFGSMDKYGSAVLELDRALESMDASSIDITIPKIDYGYTGSFNNASIRVSKANGGDNHYISYGPSIMMDRLYGRPPNGKLTIEEYSHRLIEGTFSANLVDESNRGKDKAPIIAKSISGRFYIPSPYITDRDFSYVEEHLEDEMVQSMIEIMPLGHEAMRSIIESSGPPPASVCEHLDEYQIKAMGFKQGCESTDNNTVTQCSCECDDREEEEAIFACEQQCARQWRQCPLPDEMITNELAEQVAYYKSLLAKQSMPEELQVPMIDAFMKMPPWQRKLVLQGYK